MDIVSIIAGILGGVFITYPISRLTRKLFSFLKFNTKQLISLTYVVTVMLCVIFVLLIGDDGQLEKILYYATGMAIHTFLDFKRAKSYSKTMKLLYGWPVRWPIILLSFLLLFMTFNQFTSGAVINDPYYISPLAFAFIWTYFAFKRPKDVTKTKRSTTDFERTV